MVCVANEVRVEYVVGDGTENSDSSSCTLPVSTTIEEIYERISILRKCEVDSFELNIRKIIVPRINNTTLLDLFPDCLNNTNPIQIYVRDLANSSKKVRKIKRMNVAKPKETCNKNNENYEFYKSRPPTIHVEDAGPLNQTSDFDSNQPEKNYVGLVNQAMTCYLNSLLQTLFMTPEFRNALYNWEYDSEKDQASSIPYQLQKLFLNLQTSTKGAIETTSLTKSFGWDSSEGWQQHDIQELCRVMFDALETKFQNTEQADLISRLYEGKMIDYVKCLECKTEKKREDTFLDIPLPVRPFGSTTAYESVVEALTGFVKYETLDGNNQYHCDKCDKKCDAHKGLKFTKFPYILTLHLKRFDFDFKSLYRIKLNDRVAFPHILNLNSFIMSTQNQDSPCVEEDAGVSVKFDDTSTTDSGTLEDDCPLSDSAVSSDNHSNNDQGNDEGVDMSNGSSTTNGVTHNHESDKNHEKCSTEEGPYIYELFSIMIHNGSANGGHYYAYIKDFTTNQWLCFNDTNVTPITDEHIEKVFGGGPPKAYSCSTNAYMLMYRQQDPNKNALPMQEEDFPQHIKALLQKIKQTEDEYKRDIDKCVASLKMKVCCHHPTLQKLMTKYLLCEEECTVFDLKKRAHDKFGLYGEVDLEQCRLVFYDSENNMVRSVYSGSENDSITNFIKSNKNKMELLLEIRKKDQEFEEYVSIGLPIEVYVIDVNNRDIIDGPFNVRSYHWQTGIQLKEQLSKIVKIEPQKMNVYIKRAYKYNIFEDEQHLWMEDSNNITLNKVYVTSLSESVNVDDNTPCLTFIKDLQRVMWVHIELPNTNKEYPFCRSTASENEDKEKKVSLYRPTEEIVNNETKVHFENKISEDCVDGVKVCSFKNDNEFQRKGFSENEFSTDCSLKGEDGKDADKVSEKKASCYSKCFDEKGARSKGLESLESTSEDSSLSDSEKTLVDDSSDGHINKSPEGVKFYYHCPNLESDGESSYYFKSFPDTSEGSNNLLKAFVDERMSFETLKKKLEKYVGVPADNFTICVERSDTLLGGVLDQKNNLDTFTSGQRFCVRLGTECRKKDIKLCISLLNCSNSEVKPLFDWFVSKDMTVAQAKEEIIAELKRKQNIEIPFERLRLRKFIVNNPGKVLLNDRKFKDEYFNFKEDVVIQELTENETITNPDQIAVFVRLWSRSTLELKPYQEIVLSGKNASELFEKIESLSEIPEDCLEIAKARGNFPFESSNLLTLDSKMDWIMKNNEADICSLKHGCAFFYRNSKEPLKQLSSEERTEFESKEKSRLEALGVPGYYSQRREKPLKIYLDSK